MKPGRHISAEQRYNSNRLQQDQIRQIEKALGLDVDSLPPLTCTEVRFLRRIVRAAKGNGVLALSDSDGETRLNVLAKLRLESSQQLFALLNRLKA